MPVIMVGASGACAAPSRAMRMLVAVSLCFAACVPPGAQPERFVLVGEDVEVTSDRLGFPVDTHPEFAGAVENDLVAGVQGGGFVRRIIEIDTSAGRYAVATEEVPLGDAVGDAESTNQLSTDGKADGESFLLGLSVDNKAIYADGNYSINVTKARLSFTPRVDVDLDVSANRLEHFLIKAQGRLDGELAMHIKASAGGEAKIEKPFWTCEKTFIQMVGWVPVVEVVELTVGVGVEVEAEGAFEARFDAGVTAQLTAGVEYRNGSWKNIGGATMQRRGSPATATGTGEVAISSFIYAEVSVRLYGVAGPFVEVKPNIRFTRQPDGRWARTVGVFAEAGAELALPFGDEALLRYMGKVFDYAYPI